jgi:hypothetical protein
MHIVRYGAELLSRVLAKPDDSQQRKTKEYAGRQRPRDGHAQNEI